MAIKTYNKSDPIKYKYSRTGTFDARFAGNISSAVFSGAGNSSFQSQLISVKTLSSSMEELGPYSFDGCYRLTSINLNNGKLSSLGENCFNGCNNLKEIELPESLKEMNHHALANCRLLENISFNYFDSDSQALTTFTSQ